MATLSPTQNRPLPSADETARSKSAPKAEFSPRDFSMVFALLLICGFFAVVTPNFVSARNLSNLAVELSITAVLALGMLLIILTGHIDLSIGSGVGLMGGVAAVLVFEHAWSAPLAMLLALVIAIIIWALMGTIIVSQRIPSFIITLAGLMVFKGLHWQVIHNSTIPVTVGGANNLYSLLTTWYLPPVGGWVLAALVFAIMARRNGANGNGARHWALPTRPPKSRFRACSSRVKSFSCLCWCATSFRAFLCPR